jgi:hypothetical protein
MTQQVQDERVRKQVERIIGSESLRHSETLQRLLGYLAEKSLCGEADQLKEYAIGMDLFGKGSEYDPRHDSSARIHVGRLRQKLVEYYASEGVRDPVVVTLPKGRFKLLFEERPVSPPIAAAFDRPDEDSPTRPSLSAVPWRAVAFTLAVPLLLAIAWGIWSGIALRRLHRNQAIDASWTPSMQEFWGPFVDAKRPLLIAVRTPLFVGLQGRGFYRDRNGNQWPDMPDEPQVRSIRRALNDPDVFPVHSYTGFGEGKAGVLLGILLAHRTQQIQLVRSSDLSWPEISESNVIFLGTSNTGGDQAHSLPVEPQMNIEPTGLRVVSPKPGEPSFFRDELTGKSVSGYSSKADDGVVHAVIGILPGPGGRGIVGSFSANLNAGILEAVKYATDPISLRQLDEKLRDQSGHIPRYFQVAIEVTFRGGVAIRSRYLLHREIQVGVNALTK